MTNEPFPPSSKRLPRVPHLGASNGGAALDSAAAAALRMGLVAPGGHIVCLERFSNSLGVQVIQAGVDAGGCPAAHLRPLPGRGGSVTPPVCGP